MSALALRQPNGNATFKRLIPILLVLLLVSAVTITAQNWSQPILDLIAVITGLDDLINSLNRSIENLEKKLPGLQSLETKFGKDYERGLKNYNAADAEYKRVDAELNVVRDKIRPLNARIASLDRTIHACDQWLKYHPNATPSAKRNNATIRALAVEERNAKRAERAPLLLERTRLYADRGLKWVARDTAKTYRDNTRKSWNKAVNDVKKLNNEIKTKKNKRKEEEEERQRRRRELSSLKRSFNAG